MKKFRILALLLALAMVLGLCACGGPTYDESLLGIYTCYAIEVMGFKLSAEDVLTEPATLELKQGGKGKIGIEGESGSIKYTLEGDAITVEIEGETAEGTLKDGVIDIEILSMHMFFIQDGKEIPTTTAPEVGYYTFYSAEVDGVSFTAEDLAALGEDGDYASLQLSGDGTALLVLDGEEQLLNWADGLLTDGDESMAYALDGDKITISIEGFEMVFLRSGDGAEGGDTPSADSNVFSASCDVDDYHIEVIGAEQYTDMDDKTAVRIYMNYTNNSDVPCSFYSALYCEVFQDGYQLVSAYPDYDIPEYNTGSQNILPGCTLRVAEEFVFQPDGGELELKLYEYDVEDAVVITLDPANLPGAPAEPFSFTPYDSSSLVEGLSASGTLGDGYDVTIRDLEITKSWYGVEMVRVFIDFTNNSAEATELWDVTVITAMQDGVALYSSYADDDVETDDNYTQSVEPGQSITVSMCYVLHDTGSPIAFLIDGFAVTGEVGTMLELP